MTSSEQKMTPLSAPLSSGPQPLPWVSRAPVYIPGRHAVEGEQGLEPAILSANENPLGCGVKARSALRKTGAQLHRYPDGSTYSLRMALAQEFSLNPDHIVCGAGSDELISMLVRGFVGQGDDVLMSQHGFLMYEISAMLVGAHCIKVPERNLQADPDALLAAVTPKTRILFLANPNNPTGSYLSGQELSYLRQNLPESIILAVDAAYSEYAEPLEDYDNGLNLARNSENTVMLRTFSKLHGLAALRVGWAFGGPLISDTLNRIRGPFNLSAPAETAAVAALQDKDFITKSRLHNQQECQRLSRQLTRIGHNRGWSIPPSAGNFILCRFSSPQEATAANQALEKARIIVRQMGAYGLPESLRITIGRKRENDRLISALSDFLLQ